MTTSDAGAPRRIAVPRDLRHGILKASIAAVLVLAGCVALRAALSREMVATRAHHVVNQAKGDLSDQGLIALMADAGPGALNIAADHDADAPMRGVWGRPRGWERLEVTGPPNLGLDHLSMAEAERINGAIPDSHVLNPPTAPFVLHASAPERDEAVKCLTTAIYYEAALEPRAGQEAVAQVVLNRLRHPGFPKSVCGVVFQGSDRPGCQFSFACDGSMAREPAAWAWRNARDVAVQALGGYVMKDVGTATHYHTAWIIAGWTPTLLKVKQVGSQIFFRPLGPDGQPSAFTQSYGGGEARVSKVSLIGKASAATGAPPALLQVSTAGSSVAPRGVVQGGRMIVLPPSTVYLGNLKGVLVNSAAQGRPLAPMHAMIALRAAAAKASLAAAHTAPATDAAPAPAAGG